MFPHGNNVADLIPCVCGGFNQSNSLFGHIAIPIKRLAIYGIDHPPMIQRNSGILWIAAYPRSGNTWTRLFVCNLASLLAGVQEEQNFNTFLRHSPWDAHAEHYRKYITLESLEGEKTIREIASVRHLVQKDFAEKSPDLVFAKTHWLLGKAFGQETFDFSVTAGAIYCVRNPLDVAISLARHLDQSVDYAIKFMGTPNAFIATDLLGSWTENVKSWTESPGPDICIVRYEDLINDPELWFSVIAQHVFSPAPTKAQIADAIARSSFQRLQAQEAEHGYFDYPDKAKKFFREGRPGQWKTILTAPQIHRIVLDHGALMTRFGYLPLH